MKTVTLGARPPELEAVIERRRALGQDHFDEVWEGDYHMAPMAHPAHGLVDQQLAVLLAPLARRAGLVVSSPVNLGVQHDFRVPDRVIHRQPPTDLYVPTAALVVEVLSPDDETFEKFGFYAARRVEEILVADPATKTVRLFARVGTAYDETARSALLDVTAADLTSGVEWPG